MKRIRINLPKDNRVKGFGVLLRQNTTFRSFKKHEFIVEDQVISLLEENSIDFEVLE